MAQGKGLAEADTDRPNDHERSEPPTLSRGEPQAGFWHNFRAPLDKVQAESRAYLTSAAAQRPDGKTMLLLVTVAVCLALQRYLYLPGLLGPPLRWLGMATGFDPLLTAQQYLTESEATPIGHLFCWCLVCLLSYAVIPTLVICLVLQERLGDYGVQRKGALAGFPLYVLMMAVMVPLVLWVSRDAHFQQTYPFYPLAHGEALWPNFWRWEVLYALQFFALEFFFRGFMVHGLKHRFGVYSVFVMMVPYCMIHFGKPVQETFAAIAAGIILGFMSLKTRSIWMGAVLHVSVALTMDFASLWRKGYFS